MRRNTNRILVVLVLGLLTYAGQSARGLSAPQAPLSALWEAPTDLSTKDLFNGPWGAKFAPAPRATYTFFRAKTNGVNPGVIVKDPQGRVWHVKQQTDNKRGSEGPVEVVLSRVLSAVGYHQPPVYFLPSFTMADHNGTHLESGGRFRVDDPALQARGEWSFSDNPFVGTRPHKGLLVILLVFNSWDLKSSNNTVYELRRTDRTDQWYVVRDLGGALGDTGRFFVRRNNIDEFEQHAWIRGVSGGLVDFRYGGHKPEILRDISVDDLGWGCELLSRLSDRQWHDAFRAGGYPPDIANRFIKKIKANINGGLQAANQGKPASFRKASRG
jgi:hypothetical protein